MCLQLIKKIMKKLTVLFSVLFLISCGGAKETIKQSGEVLFSTPCSGPEFYKSKDYFRASNFGESSDHVIAKKKALSNARASLASSINTTIKTVVDNYLKASEFNNIEETEERYEALSREVVKQTLSGINTICEQSARTNEGKYKFYVAIELSAQDLVDKFNETLTKNETLKIDYDYEKFKMTFEEEMSKQK